MPNSRPPAVAGQFYPASKKDLEKTIEKSFNHELGPGRIPKSSVREENILGCIVPHAGYKFSGPIMAHVYKELVETEFPKTFVILGPKHPDPYSIDSNPPVGVTKEVFEMPFGNVHVNENIVDDLVGDIVKIDSDMHASEHSIEVQIPFLQYFSSDFNIVPLCFSEHSLEIAREVGKMLRGLIKAEDVCLIASTDFTHCGPQYGRPVPSGMSPSDYAEEKDMKVIERILDLRVEEFFSIIEEEDSSMCGPGGVGSILFSLKNMDCESVLLKYASSADITGGGNAVGYGAIIIEEV